MKALVIWYNPNKQTYYYKLVFSLTSKYFVGYRNQYNHEVIMVIDVYKELIYKAPLFKRVIRKLIFFLHKLEKKL